LKDILDIFEFKKEDFREKQLDVLFSMLSNEEKKVFNLIKLSSDALTATQIYDYYIDKIINENPDLKAKIEELESLIRFRKKKKPLEVKADFARKNSVMVPTNRTVTRVLENLKEAGFVVKRNTSNKKAKAYYCIVPNLKILLEENDPEILKKREIDMMKNKLKQIKEVIDKKR